MGSGEQVRQIGLSYRPVRLHRLAESIPGLFKRVQILASGIESLPYFLPDIPVGIGLEGAEVGAGEGARDRAGGGPGIGGAVAGVPRPLPPAPWLGRGRSSTPGRSKMPRKTCATFRRIWYTVN